MDGPGRIVRTALAATPGGDLAEAALTARKEVFARWLHSGEGRWTEWTLVAAGAVDVAIAAAVIDGAEVAYIAVTPALGKAPKRGIHVLNADGVVTATML